MPDKAAASGFTLEVPVDASAISADDLRGQTLKVVVKPCDGELLSETVKLRADGTGSARFSFAKRPGARQVLIGPERAEDAELAASQTITTSVSASAWANERRVVAEPLRVSPYYWFWWLRWCREFTIRGRVVCPDGQPVPGAEVCAYDVDWWWWWWTKQEVGCAITDINGSFDITFRWYCGFWPWWWWRYRVWEFEPELAQIITPVLQRDPRIQLGRAENVPSLDVFEPLLARAGVNTAQPLASVPAGQLEQIRATLLEKLPAAPELAAARIWPWWPWWPWWDCTPDIIFRVTQSCHFPGAVIVDEGYAQTRWDIPDPLDVTLVANALACCRPVPPCNEGDCVDISAICSDEYLSIDSIAGNRGAASATPAGYALGDRPFSESIAVLKANTFVGVDYYEIEVWDPVGGLRIDASVRVDFRETEALARRALVGDAVELELSALSGDLLPDWYEEWVLLERERFRALRLRALDALCEQLILAGRLDDALDAGHAAVAGEPLRESAHRALVRVHLAEGNTDEAIRQYRLFRRLLLEHLGLEPSGRMEELMSGIGAMERAP